MRLAVCGIARFEVLHTVHCTVAVMVPAIQSTASNILIRSGDLDYVQPKTPFACRRMVASNQYCGGSREALQKCTITHLGVAPSCTFSATLPGLSSVDAG